MAWDYDAAAQLLARAGFGDPPQKIDKLVKIGRDRAVRSCDQSHRDRRWHPGSSDTCRTNPECRASRLGPSFAQSA